MTQNEPSIAGSKNIPFYRRQPAVFFLVTGLLLLLIFDFLFAVIFIPFNPAAFRQKHPYYHHGLRPFQSSKTTWDGTTLYPVLTNSLGFIDRAARQISLIPKGPRILFMGDSFTEGVGHEYKDTFCGIIDSVLALENIEVLNAAAVSYSPKLYYLKTKYLLEKKGLRFDEMVVCIDISDIQNERVYENFVPSEKNESSCLSGLENYLQKYSMTGYTLLTWREHQQIKEFYRKAERQDKNPKTDLYAGFFDDFRNDELLANRLFHHIGEWYLDKQLFDKWGRDGLISCKFYMLQLAELCKKHGVKLTVTVHPWPIQIKAWDENSIQVQFWEKFCTDNGVRFINLFPLFFSDPDPQKTIREYYIPGDVHLSRKGHRMVADYFIKELRNR